MVTGVFRSASGGRYETLPYAGEVIPAALLIDSRTTIMSKRSARWFLSELPDLVAEGILEDDAAERLRERYQAAAAGSGTRLAIITCAVFGALLIGSGVILLIAHNWEHLAALAAVALMLDRKRHPLQMAWVTVRVRHGAGVIEDLWVDGQPVREWLAAGGPEKHPAAIAISEQ